MKLKDYSELDNAELSFERDDDSYDIYVNGLFLSSVKANNLSKEMIETLDLEQPTKKFRVRAIVQDYIEAENQKQADEIFHRYVSGLPVAHDWAVGIVKEDQTLVRIGSDTLDPSETYTINKGDDDAK